MRKLWKTLFQKERSDNVSLRESSRWKKMEEITHISQQANKKDAGKSKSLIRTIFS